MSTIDRADWHYGGNYPKELPQENGGTHIGMYLNWIIDKNLIGETHLIESKEGIKEVKDGLITGRDFLFNYCDEKFWVKDLNEEGLGFTKYYYQDSIKGDGSYGQYLVDYETILGKNFDSLYEIPNSIENYKKISKQIDSVYSRWKRKRNKKSWQFWK